MDNNKNDILNRAVDELKNRTAKSNIPRDVLKTTASWLNASKPSHIPIFRQFFQPSLVAAMILIAASAVIYFSMENFGIGSVAWADVRDCLQRISFTHCYSPGPDNAEAWYINNAVYIRDDDRITKDNGREKLIYDTAGNLLSTEPSEIGDMILHENTTPFDILTRGVFEYDCNDILRTVPVYIGQDLLIYKFDAPKSMQKWADCLTITAGRQSKLPVYMKIVPKDASKQTDIYIFDYELQELPEIIKKISANSIK